MRQWYEVQLDDVALGVADNTAWAAHWFEQESAEFAEHIRRSLGQKFRHVREDEIAKLRERLSPRRMSLTDPYFVKLWARKLFEQAMRPAPFEELK